MEKLDLFNKILLATGTINYLASSVYGLNENMKTISDPGNVFKKGIENRDADLIKALEYLKAAMEVLGNANQEPCAIDVFVTTPAFMVVVHDHDEVEGDFDSPQRVTLTT